MWEAGAAQAEDGTYSLAALLGAWNVPPHFRTRVSPKWRARVCPSVDLLRGQRGVGGGGTGGARDDGSARDDGWEECEVARWLGARVPFHPPSRMCLEALHAEVGGDGVGYVMRRGPRRFERPKIAMRGGWGAPGTQLVSDDHLAMVHSYEEVLASDEEGVPEGDEGGGGRGPSKCLNLQMFHRDVREGETPLPALLRWPLESRLHGPERRGGSVTVDMATRVSKCGALTWWHLDDGGEHTFQAALPSLETTAAGETTATLKRKRPGRQRSFTGPHGLPVVKVFVYVEKGAYDLIVQDAEADSSGRFAGLDLFDTPCEHLPDAEHLPVLWLALLEAGGPPLLAPPNVLHCVMTVADCVMCEQRRVLKTFLDEVAYFKERAARWADPPVEYAFVQSMLSEATGSEVAAGLAGLVMDCNDGGEGLDTVAELAAAGAYGSLRAMASFPRHFKVSDAARLELDRALDSAKVAKDAEARVRGTMASLGMGERRWEDTAGVTRFVDAGGATAGFAAYMHVRGRPRWGPVRHGMKQARADRNMLVLAGPGSLEEDDGKLRAAHAALWSVAEDPKPSPPARLATSSAVHDSLFD